MDDVNNGLVVYTVDGDDTDVVATLFFGPDVDGIDFRGKISSLEKDDIINSLLILIACRLTKM